MPPSAGALMACGGSDGEAVSQLPSPPGCSRWLFPFLAFVLQPELQVNVELMLRSPFKLSATSVMAASSSL